jgi:uncharacterized FAD-dependent dehydrogenase
MELMKQVVDNFTRFHPKPEEIFMSDPQEEPEFIKPYFGLRLFPVWHIGSNYLHEIAKAWYSFLTDKGVKFEWNTEITYIDFKDKYIVGAYNDKICDCFWCYCWLCISHEKERHELSAIHFKNHVSGDYVSGKINGR